MNRAHFVSVTLMVSSLTLLAQVFDVDTLQYTGDYDQRINLVILGDGYQSHELPQYLIDAKIMTTELFSERPFYEYQQFFNVFAISVPSNESGASHPGTATDVPEPDHPVIEVDNYFGSTFDVADIHRALVAQNTVAIYNVLANNFPSYDQVLILVNTPYAGGTGGDYSTLSVDSEMSEVALHEMGHSFTGLADEYWAGDLLAREYINMTQETDPSQVKWTNWMDDFGIGIFQYCCGESSASWYKPHEKCKMQFLGVPFCSVCVEGTIEMIHALTNPIISYTPSEVNIIPQTDSIEFAIDLIEPVTNTYKKRWVLNDTELSLHTGTIKIGEDELNGGTNLLTVIVEDTSELLRVDGHENLHVSSVSWNIDITAIGVQLSESICYGDSSFLQGAYRTEAGVYYDTINVSGGPDSVFTTTLSVDFVDVSVSQNREFLTANAAGASYQWLNCTDFSAIEGATHQIFTASENGDYKVVVSLNGCIDTSGCYTVATVGTLENSLTGTFKVFPNPTAGRLFITFNEVSNFSDYLIRIIGSDGRTAYFKEMSANELSLDISELGPEGLYHLQLIGPGGSIVAVRKIVLN